MPGRDGGLLDTSFLIDLAAAHPVASAFVDAGPPSAFLVHPVVVGEMIAGARDRAHLRAIDDLLGRFRTLRVDPADFDRALAIMRRLFLAHSVSWPDGFIAATALRPGLPVVTLNDKHFRPIRGLRVVRPY
jgi:predicted nucleic acid-binding protein